MISFFRLKPIRVKLLCQDDILFDDDVFVLTVANTRQFGYRAYIAPDASPNDGLLNITILKPFPKILFPMFILMLFTKRLNSSKYFMHLKTDRDVVIKTDENRFHIDGEPVLMPEDITVRIKKNALRILKTRYYRQYGSYSQKESDNQNIKTGTMRNLLMLIVMLAPVAYGAKDLVSIIPEPVDVQVLTGSFRVEAELP